MYPIRLLAVGRPRLPGLEDLQRHYLGLLKPHVRLELIEIQEGRGDTARRLREEAQRLRPLLQESTCPVLLSPEGPIRSSQAFATWLGSRMDRGDHMAFALGSSHGFETALKGEIREHLSLGPMTFPHDLCRVLFLEQLYRAFAILKGGPYHK